MWLGLVTQEFPCTEEQLQQARLTDSICSLHKLTSERKSYKKGYTVSVFQET